MFFTNVFADLWEWLLLVISYIPPPKITGSLLKKANVLLGTFAAMMVTKVLL